MISPAARCIAFYLPQFHITPENDAWWGRGFTEWTNVTRARPLFRGHYQPHLPADLGFYDLRVPETRQAQADLAKAHGIEGFCYWHYWFHGKRILERPFQEVLTLGQPDFPFCLAWANETWSRRWLGEDRDILIEQTYSADDDREHARWLAGAFADPRYIRVEGRPLFLIYRPLDLPDCAQTLDCIRTEVTRLGLPNPFMLGINGHSRHIDSRTLGFDGTVNFQPQLGVLPDFADEGFRLSKFWRNIRRGIVNGQLRALDYTESRRVMRRHQYDYPSYPCVFVGWDNTPRRGKHAIILVSTPETFEDALNETLSSVVNKPYADRLIFINAWNEWAEGNHLEPDQKHGLRFLEAVRRTILIEDGASGS